MTIHPLDHLLPEQTFANLHSPPSDQPNITGFKPHKGLSMENDGFKSQVPFEEKTPCALCSTHISSKLITRIKKNGGEKLEKKEKRMMKIVATNVVASRPP